MKTVRTTNKPAGSKKESTYSDLKQRVLTLELAPGAALDEVALAASYGLSRTPLRDVFQRLAGEGYISIETNRGATVSSMDLATMRNFFQAAPMIYAAIARLATEQASGAQLDSLKRIQKLLRAAVTKDNAEMMSVHNHSFHEQLGVMAASPYLIPSLGRLLIDHTRMSHRFYTIREKKSRGRIDKSAEQHDLMIEAIEQREPARCVELTLQHWELSRSELNKYVLPDALPVDTAETMEL